MRIVDYGLRNPVCHSDLPWWSLRCEWQNVWAKERRGRFIYTDRGERGANLRGMDPRRSFNFSVMALWNPLFKPEAWKCSSVILPLDESSLSALYGAGYCLMTAIGPLLVKAGRAETGQGRGGPVFTFISSKHHLTHKPTNGSLGLHSPFDR